MRNDKFIRVVLLVILCSGWAKTNAQDVHFSQYYTAPMTFNPAMTGNYDGDWRLANNYRRQWSAISVPYVTLALAFDRQFYYYNENFSLGFMFISDKSGMAALNVNKFYLSGAYHKCLGAYKIHGGVQGGYVMKTLSTDNLTFPEQFDMETGQFNPMLANNESLNEKADYWDINSGLAVSRKFHRLSPQIGFSLLHLNRPDESFFANTKSKVPVRTVIHSSLKWDINDRFAFTPNIISTSQGGASYVLTGSNLTFKFPENRVKAKGLYTGFLVRTGFNRTTDAVVILAGMELRNFNAGISYDINTSGLRSASNYEGGLELSLIYTAVNTNLTKKAVPCERY